MEAQQISNQEIIHMALVTGQYEGDPEAEELLHSLQEEGGDTVDVRLIPCRRLEEAESELRRQKTEIIHFCGPFDESGNFLIQKKSGQILSGKTGNQIMDLIARLPYPVKIVGYPGYMTVQKARRAKGNTDFVTAMQEKGLCKSSRSFFTVMYSMLLGGNALWKSYRRAFDCMPEDERKLYLFGGRKVSLDLYVLRSRDRRTSAEVTEDPGDTKELQAKKQEQPSSAEDLKKSMPENSRKSIPEKDQTEKMDSPIKQIRQMEKQLDLVPFLVRAVAGNNLAYQKFLRGEKERPVSEPVTLPEDVKTAYQRYYEEVEPMEERKCLQIEPLALSFWHKEAKDHQAAGGPDAHTGYTESRMA